MDMVDRVADMLLNAGCGNSDECEAIARAAIEAMREPTEAMIAQGWGVNAVPNWRAMIDAALSPEKTGA